MATFSLRIDLTYSTAGRGNTVRTAIQTALDAHPEIDGTVGGSGTSVTFVGTADTEEEARAFQEDAIPQWSQYPRVAGFVGITRNSDVT